MCAVDPLEVASLETYKAQPDVLTAMKGDEVEQMLYDEGAAMEQALDQSAMNAYKPSTSSTAADLWIVKSGRMSSARFLSLSIAEGDPMTENRFKNLALEALGCFVSALGVYSFAVAAQVPIDGIAGVGAILYHLFGMPIGLSNILLNVPIVLYCFKLLGRGFFLRSVRCMVMFAFFTDFVLPMLPVYTGDRLLAAVCGGVVMGMATR